MEEIWDPLAPKVPSIARGMRILLVDSDTTSLMFMASVLESHSYKVTTIELSSIAMSIYAERKDEFDVVMANVHLHNITDLEFVQEILKKKNTPIILMSSAGVMALRDQAPLGGACHFYEKPVSCSQLREVWQHVYRERISKEGCEKKGNDGNETDRVRMVEVDAGAQRNDEAHLGFMTRKSVGIQIREGGTGSRTALGNKFQASDPKGKNKQVVGEVGSGHHGDAQATETEQLRTMAADQNRRSGDRKRANNDDDKGGRRKYKRRINPEHSPSKAGSEQNLNGRSSEKKQSMRWTRELHFKFTAAISKLGEEKANPKAIHDLMNVPNLSQRQIAHQLEKYKAQVQIIMDTCVDTPRWVPSSRNVSTANVRGTTGVPQLQKEQGGLVGTEFNPPLRLFPPVSLQPGSLNLKTPNNTIRPGYLGPNDSGHGRHRGSIQIRERETLPTPFKTNDRGKGKQALGFQGNSTAPYVPPVRYWQNPTPSPTFTRLSEEQHLMAGASPSANPPNSNLIAGTSTSAAGTSGNQNIPGDPLTGHGGFDESDDLTWLTEWLSRSLKEDNTGPPTFDWPDM